MDIKDNSLESKLYKYVGELINPPVQITKGDFKKIDPSLNVNSIIIKHSSLNYGKKSQLYDNVYFYELTKGNTMNVFTVKPHEVSSFISENNEEKNTKIFTKINSNYDKVKNIFENINQQIKDNIFVPTGDGENINLYDFDDAESIISCMIEDIEDIDVVKTKHKRNSVKKTISSPMVIKPVMTEITDEKNIEKLINDNIIVNISDIQLE